MEYIYLYVDAFNTYQSRLPPTEEQLTRVRIHQLRIFRSGEWVEEYEVDGWYLIPHSEGDY